MLPEEEAEEVVELPSDPLARARALMASGPPMETAAPAEEEDDWRSQLSDIGRSLTAAQPASLIDQQPTPSSAASSMALGSSGVVVLVLDGSSSEEEDKPAPPKPPSAMAMAAAAQAESVEMLTRELRNMIDSAPVERAVAEEEEEEDWRAALSDVGTNLIARAQSQPHRAVAAVVEPAAVAPRWSSSRPSEGVSTSKVDCGGGSSYIHDPQASSVALAKALMDAGQYEEAEKVMLDAQQQAALVASTSGGSPTSQRSAAGRSFVQAARKERDESAEMSHLMMHLGHRSEGPTSPMQPARHARQNKQPAPASEERAGYLYHHEKDTAEARDRERERQREKRNFYRQRAGSSSSSPAVVAAGSMASAPTPARVMPTPAAAGRVGGSSTGASRGAGVDLETELEKKYSLIERLMVAGELDKAKALMVEAQAMTSSIK